MNHKTGVSLVILIVTIIVLIILIGAVFSSTFNNNIITKAKEATFKNDIAIFNEELSIYLYNNYLETGIQNIDINELVGENIKKYVASFKKIYFDKIIIKASNIAYIGENDLEKEWFLELIGEGIIENDDNTEEHIYDNEKRVNMPILVQGMSPVIYKENGSIENITIDDNRWYNYIKQDSDTKSGGTSIWANAITLDGSGFVWIPRFAYNLNKDTNTIDVIFLVGRTNSYYDEKSIYHRNLPEGYIVHPAFINDQKDNYSNGGWDEELSGIWVAKFEAGYNRDEIYNIIDSTVKYEQTRKDFHYDNIVVKETAIKYPVFKANTYSQRLSLNEAYKLCRSLGIEGNPYGFTQNSKVHMMKNSQWGAVAYLTYSSYGRKGTSVTKNQTNNNSVDAKNVASITATGYIYPNGSVASKLAPTEAEAMEKNILQTTTGNTSGIYDLVGGLKEYTASYMLNGQRNGYAQSLVDENDLKYLTVFKVANPDNSQKNYEHNIKLGNITKGDAILETSLLGTGNTSWNSNVSVFSAGLDPFLSRGGIYYSAFGVFDFNSSNGVSDGFRVVVIPEYEYRWGN